MTLPILPHCEVWTGRHEGHRATVGSHWNVASLKCRTPKSLHDVRLTWVSFRLSVAPSGLLYHKSSVIRLFSVECRRLAGFELTMGSRFWHLCVGSLKCRFYYQIGFLSAKFSVKWRDIPVRPYCIIVSTSDAKMIAVSSKSDTTSVRI